MSSIYMIHFSYLDKTQSMSTNCPAHSNIIFFNSLQEQAQRTADALKALSSDAAEMLSTEEGRQQMQAVLASRLGVDKAQEILVRLTGKTPEEIMEVLVEAKDTLAGLLGSELSEEGQKTLEAISSMLKGDKEQLAQVLASTVKALQPLIEERGGAVGQAITALTPALAGKADITEALIKALEAPPKKEEAAKMILDHGGVDWSAVAKAIGIKDTDAEKLVQLGKDWIPAIRDAMKEIDMSKIASFAQSDNGKALIKELAGDKSDMVNALIGAIAGEKTGAGGLLSKLSDALTEASHAKEKTPLRERLRQEALALLKQRDGALMKETSALTSMAEVYVSGGGWIGGETESEGEESVCGWTDCDSDMERLMGGSDSDVE